MIGKIVCKVLKVPSVFFANDSKKTLYRLSVDRFVDSYSAYNQSRVYNDFENRLKQQDVFTDAEKNKMRSQYHRLWHLQSVEPEEYFSRALYMQPYRIQRRLVSRWRQNVFQYCLNKCKDCTELDNKAMFNKKFDKFLYRHWILTNEATVEELKDFLSAEELVIAKPLNGSGGKGIFKFNWNQISDGERESIITTITGDVYIIESILKQTGFLHEINSDSVNTIRVNTLLDDDNVEILSVGLRTGIKGQVTDNMHAGGIFWQVNPKNGEIGYGSRSTGKVMHEHPDSKVKVTGCKVPRYAEVIEICKEAQKMMPNIPQIGWDVVVSDDFIALIEGNSGAGISNIMNEENVWKICKKYLYKHNVKVSLWY